jgi:cobalt-zinc-cadmium efflux system membrane fusion protein
MMKTIAILLLLLPGLTACENATDSAPAEAPADEHDHDHEAVEVSDLDSPAADLFAADCEHGVKTFACDECRYEVGVARAPASLFAEGLLQTAQPTRERIQVPLTLTGEVRFDERRVTHLSPPVEGVVRRVHVALGDLVRRGAPLVELESAAAGEAQAAYREAESLLRLATSNHERAVMLRDREISAQKDFLAVEQELEAAHYRVEAAAARLSQLGSSGDDSGGQLVLRAPVDGTVLELHAVFGELAGPGESMITVGDHGAVWVWADVYERDLARVSGHTTTATVTVKAYPGEEFPGTVDLVSPAMDETSRTVKLRVAVDNPQGRLLAGMFATVQVMLPGDEQALALPRGAVLEDEGRAFVFVHHHDDYYLRRPVTTGRAWGDRIEVVTGLTGDETVVAEGSFLLKSDVLRSKMGAGCAD